MKSRVKRRSPTKRSTRRQKRSGKRSKKSSRRSQKSGGKCKEYLKKKIAKNMAEYKKGRYSSRMQAVAVSYSQVKKAHPACSRVLSKRKSRK